MNPDKKNPVINTDKLRERLRSYAEKRRIHVHQEITDDDNYYGYTEEYRIQDGYFRA